MSIRITAPKDVDPINRSADLSVYVTASGVPLERVVIFLIFPGLGVSEMVIFDSTILFLPPYQGSLVTPYTDMYGTGYQYAIRRDGGWPDGPNVRVVAYDTAGGEQLFLGV
jgi:hypothetical protein